MTDAIAIVEKNSREDVRIAIDEFRGTQIVDVRVFANFNGDAEERSPTKKGVSLKVERLPALIEALGQAKEEAVRRGLLPEG